MTATIAPSTASTQLALFDYDQLDVETRIVVRERATQARDKIRHLSSLVRQTAETVWSLGELLADAQNRLAPDGLFAAWCAAELPGTSRGTIYNAINVYRAFPELPTIGSSGEGVDVPLRALYLLAAPSTPPEAREAMIERVERGEAVTVADAQALVAAHKPAPAPVPVPVLDDEPLSAYEQAMEAAEEARQEEEARQAREAFRKPEPEPEPASEVGEVIATVPAPAVVVESAPTVAPALTPLAPVNLTPQAPTPLTPLVAAPTADAQALKQAEALVELLRMALSMAESERDAARRDQPGIRVALPDAAVEAAARAFLANQALRGQASFLAMSAQVEG